MARGKILLRFRYAFNRLPDNTKSFVVFASVLGCFLLAGLQTGFSLPGLLLGCLVGYACTFIFRPIRRKKI